MVLEFSIYEAVSDVTLIFGFPFRGAQKRHSVIKEKKIQKESSTISFAWYNSDFLIFYTTETSLCTQEQYAAQIKIFCL